MSNRLRGGRDPEIRRLRDRVKTFYRLFTEQNWEKCFSFIDPALRKEGTFTVDAYARAQSRFVAAYGPVRDVTVGALKPYAGNGNKLYEGRDFAVGSVIVHDAEGRPHSLRERWVKADDGRWYTRMVGLI